LSVPQTGHAQASFARDARWIIVDIDACELGKSVCCSDHRAPGRLPIFGDVGDFIQQMLRHVKSRGDGGPWLSRCLQWRELYPVMLPQYRDIKSGVNSYLFVEELANHLDDDAIIVTDVGAAYLSTMQSLKIRRGQRLFHSGGVSAMGYGIPAAIGAAKAGGGRQVVCLVGDGGAMVNIQELATIAQQKLPIKIFVYANNGYMTMQYTQKTHFGREAAASPQSGLGCPDFVEIASAFGIRPHTIAGHQYMGRIIKDVLSRDEPIVCELYGQKEQVLAPRLVSRINAKGEFVLPEFDDMWPALPDEELRRARSGVSAMEAAE
jgi:acetolactate synthase-1/2/3 large subunit